MGQTPTFSDHFARRAAPGTKAVAMPGGRPDRFKEKAERAGDKKSGPAKLEQPKADGAKSDAFAAPKRSSGNRQDPFARQQPQTRTAGFVKPAAPPPKPEPEVKRTGLRVVASQPAFASLDKEPVEVKYQDAKREEARRMRMGKSSSLVLVTGSAAEAAEVEAPQAPPATTDKTPPAAPAPAPAAATVPPLLEIPAPKARSGGGGGGGSGGGGSVIAPPRERSFTQDDLVGIVFGAAVLALLLMWLMRGKEEGAIDNRLVGTQFAATEPVAAVAPPPAPLVDPFGDVAVDLRPTGPIPESAVDDPNVAVAEAAPPPAPVTVAPAVAAPVPAKAAVPPVAVADRTMHAWFCTSSSGMTTASQATLAKEMATFKAAFAGRELVVRGYADTRGTSVFNAALGGERANVVADFLRTNGLTVVDARGIGELDGLDDNQNCANQRRVDVYVKGGPGETPSRTCAPEPEVEELVCG